jgi:hypothetical protein
MDTVAIKNALNKLSVYMAKVPAENRKKFSIKYIIDQLNKGEMIDNILEINNVINRAE